MLEVTQLVGSVKCNAQARPLHKRFPEKVASELGLWETPPPPPPGLTGTGKDWDVHSVEGVREQIRSKAHEDNLRRGWASNFAREAFAKSMELSRVGVNL